VLGNRTRPRGTQGPIPTRSVGKTRDVIINPQNTVGSSPPARGKRQQSPPMWGRPTPAACVTPYCSTNPRLRGENVRLPDCLAGSKTANPCFAWEMEKEMRISRDDQGSIPVTAGKTYFCPGTSGHTRVHPHACGKNCNPSRSPKKIKGKSPREVGKTHGEMQCCKKQSAGVHAFRNIPAWRGENQGLRNVHRFIERLIPTPGENDLGAVFVHDLHVG